MANSGASPIYNVTPLPKLPMCVLSIIILSEPLSSTILLPFVYFMVRDFHITDDEKKIGSYAGLIASSFFFAQFCCAIWWGLLSDKLGRRPILLIGLMGNTLTVLMFGVSKTLWWAVGSRALCGMLNGNIGVAKSMLGDMTDSTNETKAFSMFGFCWGAGCIVGPLFGGFLANPVGHFPGVFGDCEFLKKYPYFLPCFAGSMLSTIGFLFGYFFLPETRQINNAEPRPSEQQSLYSKQATYGASGEDNDNSMGKFFGISYTTWVCIGCYASTALHTMMFDEVYPLYALSENGLGYTGIDLAFTLSIMGLVTLISQFVIYPPLRERVNIVWLYRFTMFLYLPVYFLFPVINWTRHLFGRGIGETLVWYGLLINLTIRYLVNVVVYTSNMLMINTSVSHELRGRVNGIGQAAASGVRSIGPAVGGTLWSWSLTNNLGFPFNDAFVFFVMSTIVLVGWKQSFRIPNWLNERSCL